VDSTVGTRTHFFVILSNTTRRMRKLFQASAQRARSLSSSWVFSAATGLKPPSDAVESIAIDESGDSKEGSSDEGGYSACSRSRSSSGSAGGGGKQGWSMLALDHTEVV
jgi:hypothetical protein